MKFNRFIYATMAAALLAACSDKDPLGDGPDNGAGNPGENIGDGYVAVNINLPVQLVTSAPRSGNDIFDDGTANEYKVENGALLLFKGASEDLAEFAGAYSLALDNWVNDADGDNITSAHRTTVKISVGELPDNHNLYGLVMLNYTNVMELLESGKKNETVTLKGISNGGVENSGAVEFNEGDTFRKLVDMVSDRPFYSTAQVTEFFMTNAPISTVPQNSATAPAKKDVSTLVRFASDAIKNTEADALASPATSVFVERAVAKATLSSTATKLDMSATDENGNPISEIKIKGKIGWALNVTNPTSHIVRNMGTEIDFIGFKNPGGGNYRMVGNTKIGTTSYNEITTDLYRTYWCLDPNYTTAALATSPLTYVSKEEYGNANFVDAGTTPLYCHENTFDVASQVHNATTQAIVRVAFDFGNEEGTFYTINGRKDVIYTSSEQAEMPSINAIINNMDIKNAVAEAIAGSGVSLVIGADNYDTYLDLKFSRDENTGYREIKNISFKNDAFTSLTPAEDGTPVKAPEWTDEQNQDLCRRVNKAFQIAEYKDGVSYYPVRFKHFAGDGTNNDLAPWDPNKVQAPNTDTADEAYNSTYDGWVVSDDNMWLGRYGMVRNNWYDVNVSAFKSLGAPEIGALEVESDTKPDDQKETEQWVAFTINILSWAKRVQNIEL